MMPYNLTNNRLNLPGVQSAPVNALKSSSKGRLSHRLKGVSKLSVQGKQLLGLVLSDAVTVVGLISVSTALILTNGRAQLANQAKSELAVSQIEYDASGNLSALPAALMSDNNSYSTLYLQSSTGKFESAPPTNAANGTIDPAPLANLPWPNDDFFAQAIAAEGQVITHRLTLNGQPYTVAAQMIQRGKDEPTALLVRGLSEQGLNNLLIKSLSIQLLVAIVALLIDVGVAIFLGNTLVNPIKRLQKTAHKFASGARQARAEISSQDELGQLADTFNQLADNITIAEQSLMDEVQHYEHQSQQFKTLAALTAQIQRLQTPDAIFQRAIDGIRELLQADRVLVYRFDPDYQSAQVIAEAVDHDWTSCLGQFIHNPTSPETLRHYQSGQISSSAQISSDGLPQSHPEWLAGTEVQSSLVAPILVNDRLVGLICIHQYTYARIWEYLEQDWLKVLSIQVGYALAQVDSRQQRQAIAQREQQLYTITANLRAVLDPQQILATAVQETQAAIAADRVIVYSFEADSQGSLLATTDRQGADSPLDPVKLTAQFSDLPVTGATAYGPMQLSDPATPTHLAVPILVGGNLLGLMIAYRYERPQSWQPDEISLLNQISHQIGYALEQANLFSQTERSGLFAETLYAQKHQKDQLQHKLVNLLNQIETAVRGDFTVRAEVSNDEIGIVADCFNALIDSIRQMIVAVKQSTAQVNTALSNGDMALQTLSNEATHQAQAAEFACESFETLRLSLVTTQATTRQAQRAAQTSSSTLTFNDITLEQTAQTMLTLQEVIHISAKKVQSLEDASQQVSQMVSWLDNIALQTHLLAINAGLDATKAGDDGHKFAIAADEMSQLANQARQVTRALETTLNTIRIETDQVAEAITFGKTQAQEGIHLITQTQQGMKSLLTAASQIDQAIQVIDDETTAQSELSQTIVSVSQKIAQMSHQVSASSAQIADLLQTTAGLTDDLQTSLGAFQIEASSPQTKPCLALRQA
ncbi:MAG: GAF domain-containing protein [Cyanobacteria bacterium P01_F01_bin.4]